MQIDESNDIEAVLHLVTCCMSKNAHFLNDAVKVRCGSSACKNCLSNGNKCNNCGETHNIQNDNLMPDTSAGVLLKYHQKSFLSHLKQKFEFYNQSREDIIKNRFNEIEKKINIKAEELKKEIDYLKNDLLGQSKSLREYYMSRNDFKNKVETNDLYVLQSNYFDLLNEIEHIKNNIVVEIGSTRLDKSIVAKLYGDLNDSQMDNSTEIRPIDNECDIIETTNLLNVSSDSAESIDTSIGNINFTEVLAKFDNILKTNNIKLSEFQKIYFRSDDRRLTYIVSRKRAIENNDRKLAISIKRKLLFIDKWVKNSINISKCLDLIREKHNNTRGRYRSDNLNESISNKLPLIIQLKNELISHLNFHKIPKKTFAEQVLNISSNTFARILRVNRSKTCWNHHYRLIHRWLNDQNKLEAFKLDDNNDIELISKDEPNDPQN